MTRCRRPGPAPWRRRRRQRRCHHRHERQGRDDPEDHAPAVAINFVIVVVIVGCVFNFFCFYRRNGARCWSRVTPIVIGTASRRILDGRTRMD
jgi:hypothetical protein